MSDKLKKVKISYVPVSSDAKTGTMGATYTNMRACPVSCWWAKHNACYAKFGRVNIYRKHIDEGKAGGSAETLPWQVAKRGAACQYVRVNVSGDMAIPGTDCLSRALVGLNARTFAKSGQHAYTYTHCPPTPENVAIATWARKKYNFVISFSCESLERVKQAQAAGVPAVLAVATMRSKRKRINGVTFCRCPASHVNKDGEAISAKDDTQKRLTCLQCKKCMQANRKSVVVFPAHSAKAGKARATGELINW